MPNFASIETTQRLSGLQPLTTLTGNRIGRLNTRGLNLTQDNNIPFNNSSRSLNLNSNASIPSGSDNSNTNSNSSNSEYNLQAIQGIIDKYGKGKSPLTAQDYINASKETGIPVDALLTQGALESQFQTTGVGAKTNNVGNVGNTDDGSTKTFGSPYEGLLAQAKLLKDAYSDKDGNFTAELFIQNDFKGKYGRYATDPKYGEKYSSVLGTVRGLLGSNNQPQEQTQKTGTQSSQGGQIIDKTEWADIINVGSDLLDILGKPTKSGKVNSAFGYRQVPSGTKFVNMSQSKKGYQINVGTDFFANNGDDLFAVADGKIVNAGKEKLKGAGTSVTIEFTGPDGDKYYVDYNHLSGVDVKVGQEIKKGQVIGKAGSSGNATGPHADVAVYKNINGRYQFIDTSGIWG